MDKKYLESLDRVHQKAKELSDCFESSETMKLDKYYADLRNLYSSFVFRWENTPYSKTKTYKEIYLAWWNLGYN